MVAPRDEIQLTKVKKSLSCIFGYFDLLFFSNFISVFNLLFMMQVVFAYRFSIQSHDCSVSLFLES
ncbi:hypothetical protein HanRHA438_Chr00c05g0845241 [Helianthus annuus]|nr:hypothetical protein HanRHA438_Chr00c05g0845241 [Helianthus annuus]